MSNMFSDFVEFFKYHDCRLQQGVIQDVRIGHSRNLKDKRFYCDILFDGLYKKDVPFYGGTVDLISGNPHGFFCPPLKNQKVIIAYLEGNYKNPIVCFPMPYGYDRDVMEKFYNLLQDVEDMAMFHKSGSKIYFKKNGDLEIYGKNANSYIKINNSTGQVNINNNFTVDI